ncbi:MAG: hypothetical protein ROZ37_14710 [Aromatoleum sp.]|jgi:DNA-binding beta-propeller fold protein YncE|uniref:hypothetical protein n=1 Tax=Aromatoleum sp. TaxID=2307007 RepID=UPI002895E90A|nr:hypothetical protein [Aromatoleum sp.]MDT3671570.1 hypothetical protein [Aromatoleum sp.]
MRACATFIAGVTIVLLSGCASQRSSGEDEPEVQLQWPAPPDAPRYVYEAQLRSPADIRPEKEDERVRRMLTGRGAVSTDPVYRKPAAIAARKGRIYVADPPTASVVVFDVPRQRVFQMGVREPNQVRKPVSIALDASDRVYVLDAGRCAVMVYDSLGLFLFAVGDPAVLQQPSGVAVSADGQRIFVVDRGSLEGDDHKVVAYAPDGKELFRLGPRGSGPGRFNIPLSATVSPDGTLYVLDSGNFRVQGFDLEGRQNMMFGSVGAGLGQFSRPRSIAAGPDGNIFVSDGSFNNVQIFNPEGQLLMWIGKPDLRSNGPGQFGLIAGIATDETGRLYMSDHYHNKIEVYRPVGPGDATGSAR